MTAPRAAVPRRRHAFTLIELLAVVALIALVAGLVLPRIGIGGDRRTLAEGEQLAALLELARQRAAVTGTPHRVLLDLDRQAYRAEWEQPAADPEATPPGDDGERSLDPADRNWAGAERLPMAPPPGAERVWQPLPGPLGAATRLPDGIAMLAVEGAGGRTVQGRVFARFGADGSGDATAIELGDEDGNRLTLEVAPLADRVRIAWGSLREVLGG